MNATPLAGCLAAVLLVPMLARQAPPVRTPPAASLAVTAQAPAPEPALTVVEPAGDIPITGPTLFKAKLDPADTPFTSVDFYVNDQLVCGVRKPPLECRFDVGPRTTSRAIRALARLPGGKPLPSPEVTTPAADFNEETGVVSVPVTAQVVDRNGNPRTNVPRSAFRVFEDGVPQTITDFRTEGVPLEIVLAVDVSGSMNDDLPILKEAVKRFIQRVRLLDTLSVIAFNDRVYRLPQPVKVTREDEAGIPRPVSVDDSKLLHAVEQLQSRDNTALYYTIIEALRGLHRQYFAAQVVIVFTDGDDTYGHASETTVEASIRQSDARLFMIVQGTESRTQKVRRVVKRFTELSGGRSYTIDRIDELDAVLARISADIQNQYYLAYTPTNEKQDGAWRKIEVRLAGVEGTVKARQGYLAGTR
jgi:Ca-activated chloride channel homolog